MPRAWSELTDAQLRYVCQLRAAGIDGTELLTCCFVRFAGLTRITRTHDVWLCRRRVGLWRSVRIRLTSEEVAAFTGCLDWMRQPAADPVRLATVHRRFPAADRLMHGVTFAVSLQCENLWAGFLATRDERALVHIAALLYGSEGHRPASLSDTEKASMVIWMTGWKLFCAAHWPHFFRVTDEAGTPTAESMERTMTAQIRALTGGDITRQEQVLAADTWAALNELDALAQEADESRRTMNRISKH